ncbi:hypothetical protein ABQE62_05655 [Mycolicibacterium fortuitum]
MGNIPLWGQILVGVLIAVLAAAPVALITRRVNPGKGGDSRTVIAGGHAVVDQSVQDNSTRIINYHSVEQYLHTATPSKKSESDDSSLWIIGMLIAVVVAVAFFAVYSNWILLGSVVAVVTLAFCAILLTGATRRRFGSLPSGAKTVLWHVGLVAALTAAVWALVLTTDRNGVSLRAAGEIARSSGTRLPTSELLDAFQFAGVSLLFFLVVAVLFTFFLVLFAAKDLVAWSAFLWVAQAIEDGKTPGTWVRRRASEFDKIKPSSLALTAVFGAVAMFLATGVFYEWTGSSSVPTQIPATGASTYR